MERGQLDGMYDFPLEYGVHLRSYLHDALGASYSQSARDIVGLELGYIADRGKSGVALLSDGATRRYEA